MARHCYPLIVEAVGLTVGCLGSPTAPHSVPPECAFGHSTPVLIVPQCLYSEGTVSFHDRDSALTVLLTARKIRDSLLQDTSYWAFNSASVLTNALGDVAEFYSRGLFSDSARFHRLLDHVLVTTDSVLGTGILWLDGRGDGRAAPSVTPYLIWVPYNNVGLFFQPVTTVQLVAALGPRSSVPIDSMLRIGEHLYQYSLWRQANGLRFPVWEYDFPFNSGGVLNEAPWVSGLAQGHAMMLFAEDYKRTGDPKWKRRAYEVLNSFRVFWDDGGVLLPDTTHGYWWEEFHPQVRIWNGAAQNVMALGFLWQDTGDSSVKRMFDRGIQALKYNTWRYDTGRWTLYSLTQGFNTVAYHMGCYQILDRLYSLSGDPWFRDLANRWRTYVPPPGVI